VNRTDIFLWCFTLAFCVYSIVSTKRHQRFKAEEAVSRRNLAVIHAAHAYKAENDER
jgi:hypothetical protein